MRGSFAAKMTESPTAISSAFAFLSRRALLCIRDSSVLSFACRNTSVISTNLFPRRFSGGFWARNIVERGILALLAKYRKNGVKPVTVETALRYAITAWGSLLSHCGRSPFTSFLNISFIVRWNLSILPLLWGRAGVVERCSTPTVCRYVLNSRS